MKMYRFEKYFFDILTPANEYIFVFYTVIRIFFFKVAYMEIDLNIQDFIFTKNFRLSRFRLNGNNLFTRQGDIVFKNDRCIFSINTSEIDLNFEINPLSNQPDHWPEMIIGNRTKQYISWTPVWLKTISSGTIRAGKKFEIENNIGYIDYVFSNFAPSKMPIRSLIWGRMHHNILDLSYSLVWKTNTEEPSGILIVSWGNKVFTLENAKVEFGRFKYFNEVEMQVPESYSVTGQNKECALRMEVKHLNPAVVSLFAKNPGTIGRFKRKLLNSITRNPAGIKFYASCEVEFVHNDIVKTFTSGSMISEYVRFGK